MKKAIRIVFIVIFLAVFCFAGYQLLHTLLAYKQAEHYYKDTASQYVTQEPAAQTPSSFTPREDGTQQTQDTAQAPIQVDFDALLPQNEDVVGWLYSEDTVINYPVAQASDNDAYLHHMLDGSYSANGTPFLDYCCESDFSSDNSIIYGHNMHDGSMFHCLLEYSKQEYYEAHPVMYLLTPTQNYEIRLFAGFTAPAGDWPYTIQFAFEESKQTFLTQALEASDFQASVTPTTQDRIITLSTCSYVYDDARYLVMGILTPIG